MSAMGMYFAEFVGTMILIVFGAGVCMNTSTKDSYAKGSGWIVITAGWGFGVAMAVYATGWVSGAHINPAVTVALAITGAFDWALVPGYIIAQMLGAMAGATLAYLAFKNHMDQEEDAGTKLGVFSTGPAIKDYKWNFVSEAIGTFVLVFGVLGIGNANNLMAPAASPLLVGILVWAIGLSLGGATGYAINPARDLGPRIVHAILPIKGKGHSNWSYAWVPVVAPLVGGTVGAVFYNFCLTMWK